MSYLEIDNPDGVNLYMYCGNNPVMYDDPEGRFVFSVFIISVLIGVLSSIATEYAFNVADNIKEDGFQWSDFDPEFEENWKEYLVAGLEGAISGAAFGIGAGFGVTAFKQGVRISAKTAAIALASVTIGSFAAEIGVYILETKALGIAEFDQTEMWKRGASYGVKGLLNCGTGMVLGNQGFYNGGFKSFIERTYLRGTLVTQIYKIIKALIDEL